MEIKAAVPVVRGRKAVTAITLNILEVKMAEVLQQHFGFKSFSELVGHLLREKYQELYGDVNPLEIAKPEMNRKRNFR